MSSKGMRNGASDAEIIEIIDMRPVGEEENRSGES
jgi:hypothetical protein